MPSLRDPAELGHPVEDEVAPVRARPRVLRAGRSSPGARISPASSAALRVELPAAGCGSRSLGRRPDPVDAVPEVDLVQVQRRGSRPSCSGARAGSRAPPPGTCAANVCDVSPMTTFFTSCCVIVDPPCSISPVARFVSSGAEQRRRSPALRARRTRRPRSRGPPCAPSRDVVEVHDPTVLVEEDRREHGLAVRGVDDRALGEPGDMGEVRPEQREPRVDRLRAARQPGDRRRDRGWR